MDSSSLWSRLKPQAAPDAAWSQVYADLAARYGEPHRRYHDLRHIGEMTALLTSLEPRLTDAFAVYMATFFHDAILKSGAKDNEERSADLAVRTLAPWLEPARLERIATMIRATRTHGEVPAEDVDLALFLDADLAILAAEPERYRDYDRGIRAEYAHVPDFFYRRGRRKFLRQMAERAQIFHDAQLRAALEPKARANIARALGDDA